MIHDLSLKHCRNDKIIVISDTHLGVDDRFSQTVNNRKRLAEFIKRVSITPSIKELVIAGDLFDEWFVPANYPAYSDSAEFYRKVARNNKIVVDAINELISESDVKVTYVPGNHDMLFDKEIVTEIFPGINQERDSRGLGTYRTGYCGEIAIEHAHRYNLYCAPNPVSNKDITGEYPSIIPAGYFFTRIAVTAMMEGMKVLMPPDPTDIDQVNAYLYYMKWLMVIGAFPLKEGFDAKIFPINIDGYKGVYSAKDLLPELKDGKINALLYKNIQNDWEAIQNVNNVRVLTPFEVAVEEIKMIQSTDRQAKEQYFNIDRCTEVVVFGHSHDAKIIKYNNCCNKEKIYANSGTWIDNNISSTTTANFVVITTDCYNKKLVDVYVYNEDGSISNIYS